jgi:hypothetical protein
VLDALREHQITRAIPPENLDDVSTLTKEDEKVSRELAEGRDRISASYAGTSWILKHTTRYGTRPERILLAAAIMVILSSSFFLRQLCWCRRNALLSHDDVEPPTFIATTRLLVTSFLWLVAKHFDDFLPLNLNVPAPLSSWQANVVSFLLKVCGVVMVALYAIAKTDLIPRIVG